MEDIQKVILLDKDGRPINIIVFNSSDADITMESTIFSDSEKVYLEKYTPNLSVTQQHIHRDDTIRTIKRKIIKEMGFDNLSYDEVYLFGMKKQAIHFPSEFQELKNSQSNNIDKPVLGQFLMNINLTTEDEGIKQLNDTNKNSFSYKDIESNLKLHGRELTIPVPIGHKFTGHANLLFSANPYHTLPNSEIIFQASVANALLTFENHLLLSYRELENNTIYVCLAPDVFKYCIENNIDQHKISQLYFPFLANKKIDSLESLENQKQNLIEETKNVFEKISDDRMDTLYSVRNKEFSVSYEEKGIRELSMTIHPSTKTILPLENLFKQLNTSAERPFIKYKPGFKKEEMYRLYTVGISKNGKKVPLLSKSQISQYSKKIPGAKKHISMAISIDISETKEVLFCSLNSNGDIQIIASFQQPITVGLAEKHIVETVNSIIDEINKYMSENKKLSVLSNFSSDLIEFNSIEYKSVIQTTKSISNPDYAMFTSVFNIIETNKNQMTSLRYKRVENYKEMNEMDSLINHMYKQNANMDTIIGLISVNFSLTEEEARMRITKYLNEYTLLNGKYVNKSVDVIDNPGFPTVVQYSDIQNLLSITISNIDSIYYIQQLETYLDALIKASVYKDDLKLSKKTIETLKKIPTKTKQDVETENIVIVESDDATKYVPVPVVGLVEEMKEEDEDEVEDDGIFFGEDEEEYEEEDGTDELFENRPKEEEELEEKDDEEEEEEEKDDDEEEEDSIDIFKGGEKKDKSSGTFFYNKIKKLEPILFRGDMEGSYAKICPAQSNRQPVILTEQEKEEIDNDPEAKKAYGIAIKYGTNPNKPYWYMCPRYWCMKTNKPMTEEQVQKGECGGKIIPKEQRANPPPGHYIYEFTDERQHMDSDNNYIYYNPGFLDKSKSAENIGVPCCFKNPFSTKQNTRRQELNITDENIDYGNEALIEGEKSEKTKTTRNYLNVLSIERVPVPQHRWGFLPLSVELFLHTENSKSVDATNPTYIKKGTTPILRYGVEKSSKQSFVACIADIYTFHNNIEVPSIKEMRNIIAKKVSLDIYLKVHNGTLVSLFQPKRVNISDIEVEKYKNTIFYRSIDLNNSEQYNFLKFTIASYEQFLRFMKDDDSIIDHTFLWDIISSSDTGLFSKGLNIVIMEIEDNDIRDNISLLCPTNSYSETLFDESRGTVLLLKHGNYYEPIYVYGNTKNERAANKLNAIKIFYSENMPPNLSNVMKNIQNSISKYCKPADKPTTYIYKNNISAQKTYDILSSLNITIHKQVSNYRGKIIAFLVSEVKESNQLLYLPVSPSMPLKRLNSIFVDEVNWLDYETTINMLQTIHTRSEKQIPCRPMVKIEEDGMIIGIVTETNQFVLIDKPVQNIKEDNLKTIETTGYENYYAADNKIMTTYSVDAIRQKTVRNIKLETKFYKQFREKLRDEIANMMNVDEIEEIRKIADSKEYIYEIKLDKLQTIIQSLLESVINFVEFEEEVLNELHEQNEINSHNKHGFCMMKENQLCIPSVNLLSQENNEELYYIRICDEIIRYKRVKQYLFDTSYTRLESLDYNITSDEVLLMNTHVTGDYFDDISYSSTHEYVKNMPYEFAEPSYLKNTTKNIPLKEQSKDIDISTIESFGELCIIKQKEITKKNNWNGIFNTDMKELVIKSTPLCSYYVLSYILKRHAKLDESIHGIKKLLYKAYDDLMKQKTLMPAIHSILLKQFKKDFIEKIRNKMLSFESMIMNDNYVITQLDVWVLCDYLDLPVVMYSNEIYKTLKLDTKYIVLGGNMETDEYTFIQSNPYKNIDIFAPSINIIDNDIRLSEISDMAFTKIPLKEHLKSYKINLRIVK